MSPIFAVLFVIVLCYVFLCVSLYLFFVCVRLQVVTAPPMCGLSAPSTMRPARITHRRRRAAQCVCLCACVPVCVCVCACVRATTGRLTVNNSNNKQYVARDRLLAHCLSATCFLLPNNNNNNNTLTSNTHTHIHMWLVVHRDMCGSLGRLAVMRAAFTLRVANKSISMAFKSIYFLLTLLLP